jgi:hypothetical protein
MKEGLAIQELFSDDIIPVCYERLAEQPKQELISICEELGLAPDEKMLRYAEEVMEPAPAKESFTLPPFLEEEFNYIMGILGYGEK